mgnify:CR=1 FL=1
MVSSSGPWRQTLHGDETLNKYQWQNHLYLGRIDGLTYREKIGLFQKYKFNMSIHYTNTDYILHVGTLEKRKNIPALIRAFKIVQQSGFPNFKLVLVGKASNKKTLDDSAAIAEAINQEQLSRDVVLTGYLNDDEVQAIYQKAKLYVFPSINEGFGIPVLEAFKYKVPVVIANNTCLPEVAGLGAKSFNPFEVTDIAQTITLLLNDEVLRQSYIEKGNAQLQNFSWEKTAGSLMQLFKKAVADS